MTDETSDAVERVASEYHRLITCRGEGGFGLLRI